MALRDAPEFLTNISTLCIEIQSMYCHDDIPWIIGYSGGKDSTAVLQLVWQAIATLSLKKRTKPIHVISTDTLVENPFVSAWVRQSLEKIEVASTTQALPFKSHLLQPQLQDTFWINLIGKGYPAPRNKFRWCTERLKINPSNNFVRDVVRSNGECIVVLGTRKAESSNRAAMMTKHEINRVKDRLSPNAHLPNSLIYSPIEDWSNDEVWLYLMQWENPWGHSNKDLFTMYKGATADNDCPLVVDTSTPSCGSSRFGCWVCTLVDRDKSMEAMIQNDEEKAWMEPLLAFRDELEFRDNEKDSEKRQRELEHRDFRRMHGNVQLFERNSDGQTSIEPIPGPYIKSWREHLLKRLLEAQQQARQHAPENMRDITLISEEELSEIRRIWREDKHEFDDSLPRIYREATGQIFRDPRPGAEQSLLGGDEWSVLADICDSDPMHLELMAKLLDTERQYAVMGRRAGIYETLEKCFETSSRTKEDAIQQAHQKRDLKNALEDGDVDKVKQITTWADLKFKRE